MYNVLLLNSQTYTRTHAHTHMRTHTVHRNLADVFYLCILMMAYGPVFIRATIHGIVLNIVQSLSSLPQLVGKGQP